ncbi:ThrRS/AlaRS common domain-containing protein [Hyaloscypha bicolor E]|uniref:ThrRS/AlaRS common domain-containing protein n=1 Tax=Hyaloscypha bicolor E TaxID=1095630 RepID=A0A2J6SQC1_9HELO|nr:ThrRS/AlaRS common domain-containing protein [Hyaloscypha bicolor E]PMD52965.1 ThrRS/AlaRS common domain-containing protein [Hyaloscypha bicolor E]
MPLLAPNSRSRVVGDLACQRDSYLRTLDSEVTSCIEWSPPKTNGSKNSSKNGTPAPGPGKLYLIEFMDSVLFPEGGGQPTDHGTIIPISSPSVEPIAVNSIQRQGLRCVYQSPQPLDPGTRVRQEIDFRRRWDHMQQHTGQHLLSAIMDKYDNLESVGWGMGAEGDINYIDLPRKPTDEEMQTIQEKCNEAIRNNLSITVETPDDAKSDSLPEDYDKEGGVVRIIKIGDIDANPCCGTHLQQTSHIGLILLHHTQSIRGTNCRMYFSAGDRAIKLASSSIRSLRSIGGTLSSGMGTEEVLGAAKKMSDNLTESRRKEAKLLLEIAKYEAERVKADLKSGKKAWVYRSSGNLDYINSICFEVKDVLKDGGLIVLATGEKKTSGQVVIVGEKRAVEEFVEKMKGVVSGVKGGGKGERWQGKVIEWQKGEIEVLKNLVES